MTYFYKKGISLIEILIVLAILVILMAVALPQFAKMRENQVVKNAVADVASTISRARSLSLASVDSSEYGVHFESDKVIIFKGTTYSLGAPDNEIIDIVYPASITNVTLGGVSGSSGEIYFNRLFGAPSDNGTITISSTNFSKIITISATGGVSSN